MTVKANIQSSLKRARESEDREFVFAWMQADSERPITVRIIQSRTGFVGLTLERKDVAPTEADWQRLVALWPEPGPAGVVPRPNTAGKLHALIGRWPRPAEVGEAA